MIIVAWIIVGLFAGTIALVVFCDWKFSLTIAGIILAFCLVSWAIDYISHHQQAESPILPTSDAIAQALTNGFLLQDPVWPTNAEGVGVYHNQEVSGAIHVIVPVNKIVIHK